MPICTRRACGQDLDSANPCVYHPGSPVFHEGQKSWSCCKETNKPVLEFEEFMKIKGCKQEPKHSSEKLPVEIPKAKDEPSMKGVIGEDGKEVYGSTSNGQTTQATITQPMTSLNINSTASSQSSSAAAAANASAEPKKPAELEQDPTDAEPAEGTVCKRSGCGKTFQGGKRNRAEENCVFHRGTAIFHEGSKGWTCCKRRVLDFNDFLTIEPCTTSDRGHLFIGAPKVKSESSSDEEEAQCRLDHYETPADVRLTVYAKGVDMENSKIEMKEDEVIFSLALPPLPANPETKRRFKKTLLPFAPIVPEASTFTVSKFKVDCVLIKKQKGQSWPVLERGEGITGYGLTFGRESA